MLFKILLILCLVGFILFFPFRFGDNQCCLGEVLFGGKWLHLHGQNELLAMESVDPHSLVLCYVFPFGFLWWFSIALGIWSISQLKKRNLKGLHERLSERFPAA